LTKLPENERESADTFARLSGYATWERAVHAAKANLSVKASIPIGGDAAFGIAVMSLLAKRVGLEMVCLGSEVTQAGENELWQLVNPQQRGTVQ